MHNYPTGPVRKVPNLVFSGNTPVLLDVGIVFLPCGGLDNLCREKAVSGYGRNTDPRDGAMDMHENPDGTYSL